jgi:2-polyprenyl-3-methyl-5-hydroxy-6-metoxy-1,4-benzoquinol methylase
MASSVLRAKNDQLSSPQTLECEMEVLKACPLCGAASLAVLDPTADLCECRRCHYVFDNPRPSLNALIAFYSQPSKYDSWLAAENARDILWTRRLELLLPIARSGSILDIGAGIGQFLAIARPFFSEVCGTEVSESAIRIAHEKYGLELLRGEIQAIDFGEKKFDNITMFHVLEHVRSPSAVIQKCVSLLRDGGVLVIAVPNDLYTIRQKRLLKTLLARTSRQPRPLGLPKIVLNGSVAEIHLSHFTPQVLARLLEQFGLTVLANTLDPYYVATGFAKWKEDAFYAACRVVHTMSQVNIYDTMLLIAQKSPKS